MTRSTSAPIRIRRRWIRRQTDVLPAAGAAMLMSRPARPESRLHPDPRPGCPGHPVGMTTSTRGARSSSRSGAHPHRVMSPTGDESRIGPRRISDHTALQTRFRPRRRAPRNARMLLFTAGPTNLLCAMQIIEAASIIGLIRRTQALTGRVGVVAGVLGLFRRDAVQAVGGYRGEMATEDIDLSWRLLLAGWLTSYEPAALVGMQVPARLPALWAQRRRWARGQGEVLRVHFQQVLHPRHWEMWPLAFEALASLVWILCLTAFVVLQAIHLLGYAAGIRASWPGLGIAWGVAVAVVATVQLLFAL